MYRSSGRSILMDATFGSSLLSKANFVFRQFNFLLGFRAQSAKKPRLRFAIFNCSKKLQDFFEIGLKKCGVIVEKSLSKKNYFEINNSQTGFCSLYVKLATVQI